MIYVEYEYIYGRKNGEEIYIDEKMAHQKPGIEVSEGTHVFKKTEGNKFRARDVILKELRSFDNETCDRLAKGDQNVLGVWSEASRTRPSMFAKNTPGEELGCWQSTKITIPSNQVLEDIKKEIGVGDDREHRLFHYLEDIDWNYHQTLYIKEPFDYVYRHFFNRNL